MGTARVMDLLSHSQSNLTVTLTRQQSSGLWASTGKKRKGERQQVIMETKRREREREGGDWRVIIGKWKRKRLSLDYIYLLLFKVTLIFFLTSDMWSQRSNHQIIRLMAHLLYQLSYSLPPFHWPAQSLDLNPIWHLLGWIGRATASQALSAN